VTENRLEDRSNQREATKRSVGLSTARVVDVHRVRYQRRWMATVRHLICVSVWCMSLDGGDQNGDRHRNTSTMVEVVWRQYSQLRSRERVQLLAFARLQSFSDIFGNRASH